MRTIPQRDRKKAEGQRRAIAEHEAKKARFIRPEEKATAQKTIKNAQKHLDRLKKRK